MNQNDTDIPLVVDLDGTLLKSDSLWEGFYRMLAQKPWRLLLLPQWLSAGRSELKRNIAPFAVTDVADWPYNQAVLEEVKMAREKGRVTYLATAAEETIALAVNRHLRVFDEVFASNGTVNLKGEAKLAKLLEYFPNGEFEYIGDSASDLPIWTACRRAGVVAAPGSTLPNQIDKPCDAVRIFPRERLNIKIMLRVVRAHQWVKNLLVFVPLFLGHQLTLHAVLSTIMAVVAFSFCASSIYVMNDLLDLPFDRKHEHKRERPFAASDVPLWFGVPLSAGLFVIAAALALPLPWRFMLALLSYFVLTCLYSYRFKRVVMLDVIVLAGFYVLRIIAGTVVNNLPMSNWLLGFACFIFLGLALLKRTTEMPVHSKKMRRKSIPGRAYSVDDKSLLESMAVMSGFCSITILSLYIDSLHAAAMYSTPFFLWGLCPVMMFWYGRVLIAAHRGVITRDPISYVIRDKTTYYCAAISTALLLLSV